MAFNIQEFTAEVGKRGVMRNNKFTAVFTIPPGFASNKVVGFGDLDATNRTLELYCEECNIPGAAMLTSDIRRYAYGPTEKRPFAPAFTDINMVLRCDAKGLIHSYFHNWMRMSVCYEPGSQGIHMPGQPVGTINEQYLWELGYKDNYAVPVTITAYDDAGHRAIIVTLIQAFPAFVGDLQLNWAARGEYARLPISLTFFDFSINRIAVAGSTTPATQSSPPASTTTGGSAFA